MNLIPCEKNCLHQKEGFCNLELDHAVALSAANDCAYFHAIEKNSAQLGDGIPDVPNAH